MDAGAVLCKAVGTQAGDQKSGKQGVLQHTYKEKHIFRTKHKPVGEMIKNPFAVPGVKRAIAAPQLNPQYTFASFREGDSNSTSSPHQATATTKQTGRINGRQRGC